MKEITHIEFWDPLGARHEFDVGVGKVTKIVLSADSKLFAVEFKNDERLVIDGCPYMASSQKEAVERITKPSKRNKAS